MTKKIELTHLAVLTDGTLRLVRTDGDDGIVELAAMAVGDEVGRRSLADVVSAALVLAEVSATLGGGKKKVVTVTGPKGAVHPDSLPRITEPEDLEVVAKPAKPAKPMKAAGRKPRPAKPSGKGDVMDRLHGVAAAKRAAQGKRPKRPSEKRYTDGDIYALLEQAVASGKPGMRAAEVARVIFDRLGEEYYHKDPMAKSVNNRMRNMWNAGLLAKSDDSVYSLPRDVVGIDVEPEGGEVPSRVGDPVEKAGDSVDDSGNFPEGFSQVTWGSGVAAGINGVG